MCLSATANDNFGYNQHEGRIIMLMHREFNLSFAILALAIVATASTAIAAEYMPPDESVDWLQEAGIDPVVRDGDKVYILGHDQDERPVLIRVVIQDDND